jgi:hypothetical protein
MALVNPNIAMSFRQPEFKPRNALAEYAQVQQIMGGQRQAEMADMQMESLRRERDALGQIQAAIVAKGGPPDLDAAADAMIRTGRPEYLTQGMAIRTALRNQREAEAYRKEFGGGAAAPSAAAAPAGELVAAPIAPPPGTVRDIAPAGAPGAASRAVFNQDAIAGIDSEAQKSISLILDDAAQLRAKADEFRGSVRASGFLNQAEQLENQAASMLAVQKRRAGESRFDTGAPATAEQVNAARQALAVGQAPVTNTLAPAAAPVTNAMLAPAAQPAVPPAGINQLASAAAAAPDANAARLRALEAQYRRIGNNPELASEKALVLKQIEDVQATIRAENATPPEAKFMRSLGLPLTREGFAEFEALKQRPGEFERLLSQSGLSKTDQTALIQQRLRKEVTHAPGTTVNVSTEKKYGERFGGLIADRDAGKLDAAEGAPRVIENADRITDILASGKVFTGTGANVRLQIAKALNLAGGTDTERIANTEVLISSLANSTLGAIKSSNLGAGQGFTNADRDFLEKAASGQITYDATSLRRLAELGRKVGVASIESWNNRVRQMPRSALEGAGISADPLPIPARRPASATTIPQAAIDMLKSGAGTREQFDAQFGPGSADRVLPKGK